MGAVGAMSSGYTMSGTIDRCLRSKKITQAKMVFQISKSTLKYKIKQNNTKK